MKDSTRDSYIDILRAAAIFLIVLGHCRMLATGAIQWIYSFHVPLFFIIYGSTYNLNPHKNRGFLTKKFLIAKFFRLYIPFIIWAVIYSAFSFKNLLLDIYASHEALSASSSLTSLWFLACMFLTVIIYEGICMISSKFKRQILAEIVLCIFSGAVGFFLPQLKYGYPLCANIALVSVLFIITGHLIFQKVIAWFKSTSLRLIVIVTIVAGLISVVLYPCNLPLVNGNNVEMATGDYGNIFLFYVTAVAACVSISGLVMIIVKKFPERVTNVLAKIGCNTIGILVFHKPIVQFIARFVNAKFIYNVWFVNIIGIIISMAVLYGCYILTIVLKKYIPELFGESIFYHSETVNFQKLKI